MTSDSQLTEFFSPFFQAVQSSGATNTRSVPTPSIRETPTIEQTSLTSLNSKGTNLLYLSKKVNMSLAGPLVCGGGTDKPHKCPLHVQSSVKKNTEVEIKNYLKGIGYHNTYYPGCGVNPLYPCSVDFSLWVNGSSVPACTYGAFRSQAVLNKMGSQWSFWTQSPEPNPEILNYSWPATWWGSYVFWWHSIWPDNTYPGDGC
jgi:hypothetical protein